MIDKSLRFIFPGQVLVNFDSTALVGMESFEAMMKGGSRSLNESATGVSVAANGDVVVGGRVIKNKLLQERAKAYVAGPVMHRLLLSLPGGWGVR